jgi:signal transduction histidine kinase
VFTVRPPWYREPWALGLFALALAATLTVVYRARVAVLLGLERQRARIAMDLHDEIGSALGSIGILSGVLAQDRAAQEESERIAREIARTAGEVGDALSGLVWALDPRPGTLHDLAARLADHGERLFAADHVEFRTRFPSAWPAETLPLELRGDVVAVGLEALHNASRHAQARHVTLALEPRGAEWEMAVSDDGVGLSAEAETGQSGGLGLRSARRRADEIGGRVAWEQTPGGGTTVRLTFTLAPRHGRLSGWWARVRRSRDVAR